MPRLGTVTMQTAKTVGRNLDKVPFLHRGGDPGSDCSHVGWFVQRLKNPVNFALLNDRILVRIPIGSTFSVVKCKKSPTVG